MFFWKTSVVLDALREFQPKTSSLLASLPPFGARTFMEQLKATFPLCENISIDYAVLERSKNVVGLRAADIGWNDVGSWNAVYELHKPDKAAPTFSAPTPWLNPARATTWTLPESWWRCSESAT